MGWLSMFPSADSEEAEPGTTVTEAELQRRLEHFECMSPTSGWERVKYLLSKDEFGNLSPCVSNIMTATSTSGLCGFVYGGYKKSQIAYMDFMRTEQASKFLSHTDAKRRLQDKFALALMKGGAQLAWRTSLFSFMFMSIANAVAAYRNKDGILEYTVGVAAAGMAYRSYLGIRGIIVGGILGATMGTAVGSVAYCTLLLTGVSMTDIKNQQYLYLANRRRMERLQIDLHLRDDQFDPGHEAVQKLVKDESEGKVFDSLDTIETKGT